MKHNHKWVRPLEVVGGCDSNPGVQGLGGTWIEITEVCARCGRYRVTTCGDERWEGPEAERRIEYLDADETSLAWVDERKGVMRRSPYLEGYVSDTIERLGSGKLPVSPSTFISSRLRGANASQYISCERSLRRSLENLGWRRGPSVGGSIAYYPPEEANQ
jgi:hypothetical protein